MAKYFLVLDVGTTGVKALVFSPDLKVVGRAEERMRKAHPKTGWVEQLPQDMVQLSKEVLRGAVRVSKVSPRQISALGITNQRETTIVWNSKTGKPVYPAIVWEDKRTAKEIAVTKRRQPSLSDEIRRKTGLVLDPYFSATKARWILKRVKRDKKELLFGTVDTWVLWNLLEGRPHLTDWTNASRTLMYNIRTLEWDEELLRAFGVPRQILPKVRPSQSHFGWLRKEILGVRLPVRAVCGDQQASMYGVGMHPGATKVTYGTGTFLVQALGSRLVLKPLFFTTLMPGVKRPGFALEAKIEGSGAAIDRVLHDSARLDKALTRIAKEVDVYLKKLPIRPKTLVVDGGITRASQLLSIQAQVSSVQVRRQTTEDGTALGVAKLLRDQKM